jgi:NitT/TauT family transport system substrate-binding protein
MAASVVSAALLLLSPAVHAQGHGETVKFQDYPGLGNLLIRVAIKKGYCEKAGIKCELQVIPTAPLGAQATMAGSIQSFMATFDVVNAAVQRGAKMKMVVGAQDAVLMQLIYGNHMDAPNAGKPWPAFMQDLKGKKIGVASRGSATETYIVWMLNKAGINPDKVTFVAVGSPDTGYAALNSRQVDALMTWDPAGAMCLTLNTCKVVYRTAFDRQPSELFAINGGASSNVFMQDYIDKNPQVIEAVVNAARQADAFINDPANFDEVAKISQDYYKAAMPRGDEITNRGLRDAIASNSFRASINRDAVQAGLDLFVAAKQIQKAAPLADLIYEKKNP